MISGGVVYSLPGQKGQNPPFFRCEGDMKSVGLFPLSIDIMTHLPTIGSFRNSGIFPPNKNSGIKQLLHSTPFFLFIYKNLTVTVLEYYITMRYNYR
jgi:hypothetical protein